MFSEARLKLTFLYSAFFILFFWVTSGCLYLVMENFLNGSYITQVRQEHLKSHVDTGFDATNVFVATTAGNVALYQLGAILLYVNVGLLFIIPLITWMLTGQTLTPLKQAHDREQVFVSDASHELKTPLSIILGEADVALTKPRKASEYRLVLTSFKEEVSRLYTLVDNLLLLARTDQEGLANTFQSVDLVDLVFQVINSLKQKMNRKQLTLEFEPPDLPIVFKGNSTLMKQLIFNLVDNAVKYNKDKGKITIILSKTKKDILLKVKDSGIGIPKTSQEHIFDRFYRADASRSQTKGYGLGLAITKNIVSLHHGAISVASNPGRGAAFTVQIPNR